MADPTIGTGFYGERSFDRERRGYEVFCLRFRTALIKTRKNLSTNYLTVGGGFTNIRPSHYFISIPRSSVSYKATEMPQNDSIVAKNKNYKSISGTYRQKSSEFDSYWTKYQNWKSQENPALPSQRREEGQDMSKTLRQYQTLRRTIADEARKTAYSNNRWRESVGQVINTTKGGQEKDYTKGLRVKAFLKYQKKHQEIIKRSNSKWVPSSKIQFSAVDLAWSRKRKIPNKEDTFSRIQRVAYPKDKPITLRDTKFWFKKWE